MGRLRAWRFLSVVMALMLIMQVGAQVLTTTGSFADQLPITALSGNASQVLPEADDTLLQFTSQGHVIGFSNKGVTVASADHMLKVEFLNARGVKPESDGEFSAEKDSGMTAPLRRVTYRNVWDDVTVVYEASEGAIVKSTYYVGATDENDTAQRIRLCYNRPVHIDEKGNLVIDYENGTIVEGAPVAWQEIGGERKQVKVAYAVHGEREVGFSLGDYIPGIAVVIDPPMIWNTFLGGSGTEDGQGIAVDGSGNVYVTGRSGATWGSPVRAFTPPEYSNTGYTDAFVAKLDSSGSLIWNTFLGTSMPDEGYGITIDSSGNIYVTGISYRTWGTPVRACVTYDAFVAKLDSSGGLTWNTFLGGSGTDWGYRITVDGSGNAYICGVSYATWGTPVRPYAKDDAFVAKLDSSGGLTWNTFLGSSNDDHGFGIVVDGSGNVYIAGNSYGTWGTPVRAFTQGEDGFAAKLDSNGGLTWNTFLGGSGSDRCNAIALDASGNIYVCGWRGQVWGSPVFTPSPYPDGLVAKLDNNGNLTWHTFLGSHEVVEGKGIEVDGGGNIYIVGWSFGTWGTPVRAFTTSPDAFAAKINTSGGLTWNTFLGSSGYDHGYAIALDSNGNVYISGSSPSTWGTPVQAYTPSIDEAFAVKLTNNGGGYPTVATNTATNITTTSAILNGNLIDLGTADSCDVTFQWGISPGSYTSETAVQGRSATGAFSDNLIGLSPSTTYYFRAKTVGDGIATGTEASFTTGTTPPSVSTDSASNVTFNAATLGGNLISPGTTSSCNVTFQWGTSPGSYTSETVVQVRSSPGAFSDNLTGLNPSATYYFRAKAVGKGTATGTEGSFTTGTTSPVVSTGSASNVTFNSATLGGNLLWMGATSSCNVTFQWGTSPGSYTSETVVQLRSSIGAFSTNITGLTRGLTYYFRAKAVGQGTATGAEGSFITGKPPSVSTRPASNVTTTSATLNGYLTDLGTAPSCEVTFKWGTECYMEYMTNETTVQVKNSTGAFSANITGLTPGVTYYCRAKAVGDGEAAGTAWSIKGSTPPDPASNVIYFRFEIPIWEVTGEPIRYSVGWFGYCCNQSCPQPVTVIMYNDKDGYGTAYTTDSPLRVCEPQITQDQAYIVTPMVSTGSASNVTSTQATLSGNLISLGVASSCNVTFQWGTSPGSYSGETPAQVKSSTGAFSNNLTGLTPATTYYFRTKAVGQGMATGTEASFTTGISPLTVTTNPTTNITNTTATLNGELSSLGTFDNAFVSFQWGTSPGTYIINTASQLKTSAGTFSDNLTGLTSATTYYLRARAMGIAIPSADNEITTVYGTELNFNTGASPPAVTTDTATSVLNTSATLNGTLISVGTAASCNVTFLWSTSHLVTAPYTGATETTVMVKTSAESFSDSLLNLTPDTTYYFMVKSIGDGTIYGEEKSFTTGTSAPVVISLLSPSGGEIWQAGTTNNISWQASSPNPGDMNYAVQLSTDGGTTYPTNIVVLPNQQQGPKTFSWAVSANVSSHCRIKIVANDNFGNTVFTISPEFSITAPLETANIALHPGWNLISLQIVPTNTDIESVLASILPDLISVWSVSGGDNVVWTFYAAGAPSNLNTIVDGRAYWINVRSDTTLSYQGSRCPPPPLPPSTYSVPKGWNFIGFKSRVNTTVSNYLEALDYATPIFTFNGGAYLQLLPSDNMTPGSGYIIYCNSAGVFVPGCN